MRATIAITLLLTAANLSAEIFLPPQFSDNMILQRDSKTRLWGKASSDDPVWVEYQLGGEKQVGPRKASKDENGWSIEINTRDFPKGSTRPGWIAIWEAKKPNTPAEKLTLKNVLVGDIWLVAIPPAQGMALPVSPIEGVRFLSAPEPPALSTLAPAGSFSWTENPGPLQLISSSFAHYIATMETQKGIPVGILEISPEAMEDATRPGYTRARTSEAAAFCKQIEQLLKPARANPNNRVQKTNEWIETTLIDMKHRGTVTNIKSFSKYVEFEPLHRGDFKPDDPFARVINFQGAIRPGTVPKSK